jgi:hypothetical protein
VDQVVTLALSSGMRKCKLGEHPDNLHSTVLSLIASMRGCKGTDMWHTEEGRQAHNNKR